jgi:uncharacterized protein (DUF488 family)
MSVSTIYTIGHSTHTIEYFLTLLKAHAITCVVDVRSMAASRYNPQYNKESLSRSLKQSGITYLHFAEEFGARRTDPAERDNEGHVDFEKVRASPLFKRGVERLHQGLQKGYTIALMCAEAEPLDCHRFLLISVALENEGLKVLHILKDKSLRTNPEVENALVKKYQKQISAQDIFNPTPELSDQIAQAYKLRSRETGHRSSKKE